VKQNLIKSESTWLLLAQKLRGVLQGRSMALQRRQPFTWGQEHSGGCVTEHISACTSDIALLLLSP